VNLNLLLAALWAVIGVGILLVIPSSDDGAVIAVNPERRMMLGGFALMLAGYNIIRWRFTRANRRLDEEAAAQRPGVRPHRREEPPNPDFDFSDPKAGGDKPSQ
jgi:hypothetical protein